MLYESLKQSIVQYEKKKKQTEGSGDKKVFRWKVLALGFCILTIVIIGILSQIIKGHKNDASETQNTTFLPQLLQLSTQLNQVVTMKYLLTGMAAAAKVTFNKAEQLFIGNWVNSTELLTKIDRRKNILFLFSLKDGQNQTLINFGMLLKKQYDSSIDPIDSVIYVQDSKDDLNSVFFNLNRAKTLRMSLDSSCKLYALNQTSKGLTILQSLQFKQGENIQDLSTIEFQINKLSCFGNTQTQAITRIKQLTGIQLSDIKETRPLQIQKMQVFHLTLNGQQVE